MLKGKRLPYDWHGTLWTDQPHHRRAKMLRELCGGYCLGCMQLGLDGEYAANHLRLKHWRNRYPCNFCNADQGQFRRNPWEDFRRSAPWKRKLKTSEEWFANLPNHPIWLHFWLLGLTVFCYCVDMMHCLHKGERSTCAACIHACPGPRLCLQRRHPHKRSTCLLTQVWYLTSLQAPYGHWFMTAACTVRLVRELVECMIC